MKDFFRLMAALLATAIVSPPALAADMGEARVTVGVRSVAGSMSEARAEAFRQATEYAARNWAGRIGARLDETRRHRFGEAVVGIEVRGETYRDGVYESTLSMRIDEAALRALAASHPGAALGENDELVSEDAPRGNASAERGRRGLGKPDWLLVIPGTWTADRLIPSERSDPVREALRIPRREHGVQYVPASIDAQDRDILEASDAAVAVARLARKYRAPAVAAVGRDGDELRVEIWRGGRSGTSRRPLPRVDPTADAVRGSIIDAVREVITGEGDVSPPSEFREVMTGEGDASPPPGSREEYTFPTLAVEGTSPARGGGIEVRARLFLPPTTTWEAVRANLRGVVGLSVIGIRRAGDGALDLRIVYGEGDIAMFSDAVESVGLDVR